MGQQDGGYRGACTHEAVAASERAEGATPRLQRRAAMGNRRRYGVWDRSRVVQLERVSWGSGVLREEHGGRDKLARKREGWRREAMAWKVLLQRGGTAAPSRAPHLQAPALLQQRLRLAARAAAAAAGAAAARAAAPAGRGCGCGCKGLAGPLAGWRPILLELALALIAAAAGKACGTGGREGRQGAAGSVSAAVNRRGMLEGPTSSRACAINLQSSATTHRQCRPARCRCCRPSGWCRRRLLPRLQAEPPAA